MALSDYQQKRLSKTISTWLRHHPEKTELVPDEFGWVNIDGFCTFSFR